MARTALQLGLSNVGRGMVHKARIRTGAYRRRCPLGVWSGIPVLTASRERPADLPALRRQELVREADEILDGRVRLFFHCAVKVGARPDWHANPITGARVDHADKHWSDVSEFDADIGDIKTVWETSRFDWLLVLSRAYAATLDKRYLDQANAWLVDWLQANPPNRGPNWRCGQETALRVLAAMEARRVLGTAGQVSAAWDEFLRNHAQRVEASLGYARAQRNNHALSEAVALFVIGLFLQQHAVAEADRRAGARWARLGRRLIEVTVRQLFMTDGSFSQHSVTYHRLALDLLSAAEHWRSVFQDQPFTPLFQQRAIAAMNWLSWFTEPTSGEAPNIGPNDGGMPLRLTQTGYRDFRPAVIRAAMVFGLPCAFSADVSARELSAWLSLPVPAREANETRPVRVFEDGGYVLLEHRPSKMRVFLRVPRQRFRPTHADPLHMDVWVDEINLLRDGGSYSYAQNPVLHEYFRGIESHNTVQFDGREPMPILGRFLHGNWLADGEINVERAEPHNMRVVAAYRDAFGARHERTIELDNRGLRVTDKLSGIAHFAVIRWRLSSDVSWTQSEHVAESELVRISARGVDMAEHRLVDGWESRHYLDRQKVVVLEGTVRPDAGSTIIRTTLLVPGPPGEKHSIAVPAV